MARYPSKAGRGKGNRSWIYIFAAVVIVVIVVAFVYGPRSSTGNEGDNNIEDLSGEGIGAVGEVNMASTVAVVPTPVEPVVTPEPVVVDEAEPVVVFETEPNLSDVSAPTSEGNSTRVAAMILEAADTINTGGDVIKARGMLNDALKLPMTVRQRVYLRSQLSRLSDEWLFGRSLYSEDPLCGTYKVQSGDLLQNIGRKFKVPYELLMQMNGIKRAQDLKAGETLKIAKGPFNVKVYRSTFTLEVYLQNTFVKSFAVGLGKKGYETPKGLWVVKNRMIKPPWTDPDSGRRYRPSDPDYPLGSRWIGLEGKSGDAVGRDGFAIHGTNKPEELGTNGSRGCIRLHNGNAVLVYNLLVTGVSKVEVAD